MRLQLESERQQLAQQGQTVEPVEVEQAESKSLPPLEESKNEPPGAEPLEEASPLQPLQSTAVAVDAGEDPGEEEAYDGPSWCPKQSEHRFRLVACSTIVILALIVAIFMLTADP